MSLEGGDLSELRTDDLEDSVEMSGQKQNSDDGDDTNEANGVDDCSRVVSNLAQQMSEATNYPSRDDSEDSVMYEDSSHPAMQMAYR